MVPSLPAYRNKKCNTNYSNTQTRRKAVNEGSAVKKVRNVVPATKNPSASQSCPKKKSLPLYPNNSGFR